MLKWKRLGEDQWTSDLDTRFSMNVKKMGDGRWTWKVSATGAVSHMATGICNSVGAAKQAVQNFLVKSGQL